MKTIELNNNYTCNIDDEDYNEIKKYHWFTQHNGHATYAATHITQDKLMLMHRLILKLKEGEICDHKDHNGLNNQRNNIRQTTSQNNSANQTKTRTYKNLPTMSKYKGVSWNRNYMKWFSQIGHNHKTLYLGIYTSEIEAAKAYDKKALELYGEHAYTNFGEQT